jgi:hypothetical protein
VTRAAVSRIVALCHVDDFPSASVEGSRHFSSYPAMEQKAAPVNFPSEPCKKSKYSRLSVASH